jgi:KUP system potassium uptake protein
MATTGQRRTFNEAAHKLGPDDRPRVRVASAGAPAKSGVRQTVEDAASKLTSWPVTLEPAKMINGSPVSADDSDRDVVAHASRTVLALGALGVVYGDIGTSPLYAEQVIFTQHANAAHASLAGVFGIVSLIFWALTIIVSIKYAGFVMRAHNRGDGGVMALAALIQRRGVGRTTLLVTLGIFGAGLFFGDGMITPAISVTSAVEGLKVATPGLAHLVVPIALAILVGLFAIQRKGTGAVGWLFGPLILVWFLIIGILGGREVIAHPSVLQALSPVWGARFMVQHGVVAFLALGGVVLAVTGAEALYADRGHFGAGPIRWTWFGIVFPAVLLSYLGQGAWILAHPAAASHVNTFNPFFFLVPSWAVVPMVVLATIATVIASQAAITGSFSMARQAVQLGFLPRIKILHTSKTTEGQIYVPLVSGGLAVGVTALVLIFQRSGRLADIYGVAVTGTFMLDTILFLSVAALLWHTARWKLVLLGALFLTVEGSFFGSNISKVAHGAWIPLGIGLMTAIVMLTWRRGGQIISRNRTAEEEPLKDFLFELRMMDPPLHRVQNVAVYMSPGKATTPLAMKADVEHHRVFHDRVLIVSVEPKGVPYVEAADRFCVETLGSGLFKVSHVSIRNGYRETPDVPKLLCLARKRGLLERSLDLEHAGYFVSRMNISPTREPGMHWLRKPLFMAMARNSTSPIEAFSLPIAKTVVVSSHVAF